jgi:hypothetical protein
MTKIRNDLSFISLKAFTPRTSPNVISFPTFCGGVFGRVNEYRPKTIEAMPAILIGSSLFSTSAKNLN